MKYSVIRNPKYDFLGQSYSSLYPNLHKYPATMLPQIGVKILRECGITTGSLLDPYCGSGSSFASAIECGITKMDGFDINPLAVLISSVRFTKISLAAIIQEQRDIRQKIYNFLQNEDNIGSIALPNITNIDYWFSPNVIEKLSIIKHFIDEIEDTNLRNFFLIPFSETVRECSYTRNNEFKLFRMKSEDLLKFNPDVVSVFLNKLSNTFFLYSNYYYPKLENQLDINIQYAKFSPQADSYDVVLTSPPYGDSRTTVAYGQFSTLSNEWLGIDYARKIDGMLMGGAAVKKPYNVGVIAEPITKIADNSPKRALEVSSFYTDLAASIGIVAQSIKRGGTAIYVVGNRRVKDVQLPTDQFIAEQFEQNGFRHQCTYERLLSNKAMPSRNSPTNKTGKTASTMMYEYIVVCRKE